jgi:hypothetical protein
MGIPCLLAYLLSTARLHFPFLHARKGGWEAFLYFFQKIESVFLFVYWVDWNGYWLDIEGAEGWANSKDGREREEAWDEWMGINRYSFCSYTIKVG